MRKKKRLWRLEEEDYIHDQDRASVTDGRSIVCRNDVMTWLSNLHVTGGSLAVWKDRARYDVKIRFGDGTKVRASRFLGKPTRTPFHTVLQSETVLVIASKSCHQNARLLFGIYLELHLDSVIPLCSSRPAASPDHRHHTVSCSDKVPKRSGTSRPPGQSLRRNRYHPASDAQRTLPRETGHMIGRCACPHAQ